jgi:ribosomal protein S18 acetylase RimI-like enzyme
VSEEIRQLRHLTPADLDGLVDLLLAVIDDGASIGFLPPLSRAEARAYWEHVLEPGTVLLAAYPEDRLLGSVQLQLALRPNASHRAEVAKLMVHPVARRRGLGRQLMLVLEGAARRAGRNLLVLDTREGDPSNDLYRQLGYLEAGRIPRYARSATGDLHATVFYYKELRA